MFNSKEESEYIPQDNTPRSFRQLKNEHDNLYKQFVSLQTKSLKTKDSLSKLQQINTNLEKELSISKANSKKFISQKNSLEKELQDLKDYTRKLENKITMGSKNQGFYEINANLEKKVSELKNENEKLYAQIEELEAKVDDLDQEMKDLKRICKIKAEEIGFNGHNSEEVLKKFAKDLEKFENFEKFEEAEKKSKEREKVHIEKIQELLIIRESNNEELNRLEEENFHLKKELKALLETNKELEIDRNALFQCLEEMSAQEKQYEQDFENFNHQIQTLQSEKEEKFRDFLKQIEAKDEVIKRIETQSERLEVEKLREKIKALSELDKENTKLKNDLKICSLEKEELKKDFEAKEKRLKNKLSMCIKEVEKLYSEKEEMQESLSQALSKCSEKIPIEDRPRKQDDALVLLSLAKQKNIDLLKSIS